MTTQLSLYNGALRLVKERKLASLSENREPRRLLDDAWGDGASNGAVRYCLELGQWAFATRTVRIDASPSIAPDFGYAYAFERPGDLVRPVGIYGDPDCRRPLTDYVDERHYWYAAQQTIYVRYVSNDAAYGADLSLWPESFARLVEAWLAREIAGCLSQGENKVALADKLWRQARSEARSLDALNKPTMFAPPGSWVSARGGASRGSLSDRG